MKRIKVGTGKEYDVLIGSGLLDGAGEMIARACPGRRAVIVTDSNVGGYYGEKLAESLSRSGTITRTITA